VELDSVEVVISGFVELDSGFEVELDSGFEVELDSGFDVELDSGLEVELDSGFEVELDSGIEVELDSGFEELDSGSEELDSGFEVEVVVSGFVEATDSHLQKPESRQNFLSTLQFAWHHLSNLGSNAYVHDVPELPELVLEVVARVVEVEDDAVEDVDVELVGGAVWPPSKSCGLMYPEAPGFVNSQLFPANPRAQGGPTTRSLSSPL